MKRRFLIFVTFLWMLAALVWGVDPGRAQQPANSGGSTPPIPGKMWNLNLAMEQAAAERAAQGLARSMTNAQRKAAAERTKVRQAAANPTSSFHSGTKGGGK